MSVLGGRSFPENLRASRESTDGNAEFPIIVPGLLGKSSNKGVQRIINLNRKLALRQLEMALIWGEGRGK